jgi:hypothetical protein
MTDFEGKPFTDTLGEIEGGIFLRELTAQFYDVVRACMDTRKAGAIKLAIKVSPTGKGSVELDAKMDASVPEHDRPSTTFFVTPEGTLMRDDPRQPRLPLRQVETTSNDPIQVRG